MAINRAIWKPSFMTWPVWPCPHCGSAALALNHDTLASIETGPSKQLKGEDAWEVDWMDHRFTAQLVCGNASCRNVVVACGTVQSKEHWYYDHDGKTQRDVIPIYLPTFFQDALPVFPIAHECPKEVTEQLKRSFMLIWSDVASAGNCVRSAVEALLTNRGIARTVLDKKKKRTRMSLHSRIIKFTTKDATAAETLLAIKWLGNEGSHATASPLGLDGLLDAYELFEHAIEQIYVKRDKRLLKLTAGINKKKGSTRKNAKKAKSALKP